LLLLLLILLLLLALLRQVDNFEWNAGYLMEFGLYAWRPDGSVDRKLKEGSKALVSLAAQQLACWKWLVSC
jgi:hypothetical protein